MFRNEFRLGRIHVIKDVPQQLFANETVDTYCIDALS